MKSIMQRLADAMGIDADDFEKIDGMNFIENNATEEEHEESPFPISENKAKEIANRNDTLKTDFCINSDRNGITFIGLYNSSTKLVEKKSKKYWQYEVVSGDISWMEINDEGETYCDGWLTKDDLKLLRCLIDVETGDYTYYPKVLNYKDRGIIKYKDFKTNNRKGKAKNSAKRIFDEKRL